MRKRVWQLKKDERSWLKAPGRAVPLLRGEEGCVDELIGKHTPATTLPTAPPLKRGVVSTLTFSFVLRHLGNNIFH